ncbi:VWA domain-containing protein [Candidatus Thorarchaeota archaeon]|nr:MAG: VWA domain-containing protein [Candidatus Thorarchaeota archaeon]
MELVYTNGDSIMILRAKQGRNQKGLCFVSSKESNLESGVFELNYKDKWLLADIRLSQHVPEDLLILDDRLFRELGCFNESELILHPTSNDVPYCSELRLSVVSTKGLDNRVIADAISKRVNDLQDDFEGLILKLGQEILIERLGIIFKVLFLFPKDDVLSASRISWNVLEEIHLTPKNDFPLFNICSVIEIGAAAQIVDIENEATDDTCETLPRYEAAISAIKLLAKSYSGYGTITQFCGFAYSDEVVRYQLYDSQTGESIPSSSLYSHSILFAFTEWLRSIASSHKGRASNPGEALRVAIETASNFQDLNEYPTILLFCSSGIHSVGPNPVKEVKKSLSNSKLRILSLNLGLDRNLDLMEAIAKTGNGKAIGVKQMSEVEQLLLLLSELVSKGSDA